MNTSQELFIAVLNMSITASYVAVGVMFVRLLLKKGPEGLILCSMGLSAFPTRLPLSFTSVFSLLRLINLNAQQGRDAADYVPRDIGLIQNPAIHSGLNSIDSAVNASLPQATPMASVNPLQIGMAVLTVKLRVYLLIILFLAYHIVSSLKGGVNLMLNVLRN